VGYDGYPEFRIDLAQATSRRQVERERAELGDGSDDGGPGGADVVARLAFHAARTIEETARLLDLDALERAAQAIATASRVGVFGTGSSGLSGQALALRLARVGVMTTAPSDTHVQRTHAALLGAGDVAVGISHSGVTADPVAALGHARTRGARTVAVTTFPTSALAAQADVVLTTTARSTPFDDTRIPSGAAQLAVVDFLTVRVAQVRAELGASAG
jgi:DNA-binding MurR/RpiR family transcriptional regulator